MTESELIRALGGADSICKPGCSCRGKYTGPERRQSHREEVEPTCWCGKARPAHDGYQLAEHDIAAKNQAYDRRIAAARRARGFSF